jgi:hypothetical protein
VIALNQTIQGDLQAEGTSHSPIPGTAEFFKVALQAGDHVQVRTQSVGSLAPCPMFFAPGTDDFSLDVDKRVMGTFTRATSRLMTRFVAGRSGTWVLAIVNNYCSDAGASQWGYTFSVTAPHGLRLSPPTTAAIGAARASTVTVTVQNALTEPVTDPDLRVSLIGRIRGMLPFAFGNQPVVDGKASFRVALPAATRGKTLSLTARAGDNVNWVATDRSRNFRVK